MTTSAEVDILIWQDLVVDEEVAEPVAGQEITIYGVGLLSRGHPLQEMVSGAGTVAWTRWDKLNRLLWTAVQTPWYLVLAMDTLVIEPAALPGVGDPVEYAGFLHVVHGYMFDDLDPVSWQD